MDNSGKSRYSRQLRAYSKEEEGLRSTPPSASNRLRWEGTPSTMVPSKPHSGR